MRCVLMLLLACLSIAPARAQAVDLAALDTLPAPSRAQVLVLGSIHLDQQDHALDDVALAPLLDRLAAFAPDVIAVEQLSGVECDLMARHPAVYGAYEDNPYCGDTAAAQAATGLDVPGAVAAVRQALQRWPDAPSPAQRRQLAAWLMAAGESTSAVVQWWQLPEAERRAGDGLDAALVERLRRRAARDGESVRIAARLAARLGLQRLHPIDDHTGDAADVVDVAAYGAGIQRAWASADAVRAPLLDATAALARSGDALALYRHINAPAYLQGIVDSDFGAAQRAIDAQPHGRIYVAAWETRNLRMAANVRASFREHPGARVLVVVGGTHKPWLDSLLGQAQGVDIVDVSHVLE